MRPVWPDEFGPKVMTDLKTMLSGGLTFKDNFNCAIITFDAASGTEAKVSNPLRQVPLALIPIGANTLTTLGQTTPEGAALTLASWPNINLSRTDGFLGITVTYASGTNGRFRGILVGA